MCFRHIIPPPTQGGYVFRLCVLSGVTSKVLSLSCVAHSGTRTRYLQRRLPKAYQLSHSDWLFGIRSRVGTTRICGVTTLLPSSWEGHHSSSTISYSFELGHHCSGWIIPLRAPGGAHPPRRESPCSRHIVPPVPLGEHSPTECSHHVWVTSKVLTSL